MHRLDRESILFFENFDIQLSSRPRLFIKRNVNQEYEQIGSISRRFQSLYTYVCIIARRVYNMMMKTIKYHLLASIRYFVIEREQASKLTR